MSVSTMAKKKSSDHGNRQEGSCAGMKKPFASQDFLLAVFGLGFRGNVVY